jgi:hypothetical protein
MIFSMAAQSTDSCSRCGEPVGPGDGWRLHELPGDRRAAFCRLEHIVPWVVQGARWDAGGGDHPPEAPGECARCGARLGEVRVVAVHRRGPHEIVDAFCSVDHLADWAKSGGRWGQP